MSKNIIGTVDFDWEDCIGCEYGGDENCTIDDATWSSALYINTKDNTVRCGCWRKKYETEQLELF